MKYSLLAFICLISIKCCAQTANDSTGLFSRISMEDDGVWTEWHNIDSAWMHNGYRAILAKAKLKMDCAHCESIRMDADFVVDSSGKLIRSVMLENYKCGKSFDKKLEDAFMDYFYKITFPAIFRKHVITVRLGTALKC